MAKLIKPIPPVTHLLLHEELYPIQATVRSISIRSSHGLDTIINLQWWGSVNLSFLSSKIIHVIGISKSKTIQLLITICIYIYFHAKAHTDLSR